MNPVEARTNAEQIRHIGHFLEAHMAIIVIINGLTEVREDVKQARVIPGPNKDYADSIYKLDWAESVRDAAMTENLLPGLRDYAARALRAIARNEIMPGVTRKNVDDFWWQPLLESLNEAYDAAEALDRVLVEYQDRLEGVGALTEARFETSERRRKEYLVRRPLRLRSRTANAWRGEARGE